jgi:hypothetical protein
LVDLPVWAKYAMVAPCIWFCSALLGILASLWLSNVLILALLFSGFVMKAIGLSDLHITLDETESYESLCYLRVQELDRELAFLAPFTLLI